MAFTAAIGTGPLKRLVRRLTLRSVHGRSFVNHDTKRESRVAPIGLSQLPPLTDPFQSVKNSRLPASVTNAVQVLPSKDLEHPRFFGAATRLTRHPTPRIVVAEKVGSNIPGHAAKRAAITLHIEVSGGIAVVRLLCHALLTLR